MIGEDYKAGTEYAFRVPVRDSAGALQSGASPTVAIYKPDNSAESSPPSLTELGSTGVYRFAYTPDSAGAYTFIVSASSCLTTVFTVQVRATERGDTYSRLGSPVGASIAADIATVDTVVDAIQAKTDNLPASPAAVGSAMTLEDGAITSAKFASGAITAGAIAADAIGASELAADAVAEIQSGLATSAEIAALNDVSAADVQAAAAAALTSYDPPTAAELTSGLAGLNDLSAAEVQAASTAALTAYDPPTAAELTAAVSPLALEATLTAIKGDGWSTETLAAIDALIDAIKAKTDNLPASPAAVGSAMTLTSGERSSIADAVLDEEFNSAGATDNSLRAAAKAAWAQGFGKWAVIGTTLTLYGTDGTTPVRTFTLNDAENPTSRTPA